MNTLKYKGYIGTVNYSEEDEVFFGKVEGINGYIKQALENQLKIAH